MLSYGCTRLEIGLQSIYEDVARDTNRGHSVAAVGDCFRLAKNAGFKVALCLLFIGVNIRLSFIENLSHPSRLAIEFQKEWTCMRGSGMPFSSVG